MPPPGTWSPLRASATTVLPSATKMSLKFAWNTTFPFAVMNGLNTSPKSGTAGIRAGSECDRRRRPAVSDEHAGRERRPADDRVERDLVPCVQPGIDEGERQVRLPPVGAASPEAAITVCRTRASGVRGTPARAAGPPSLTGEQVSTTGALVMSLRPCVREFGGSTRAHASFGDRVDGQSGRGHRLRAVNASDPRGTRAPIHVGAP